jgi:enamine deaminase RidA (YjgF/YER057c/UK114 family)
MKRELISNGNPLEDIIGFSRAVKVGQYITIGGTAPVDKNGNTVGVGSPGEQTRQCIKIIKEALENAGSGLNDVVRTRMILTNIDDWKEVIKVRAEYFKEIKPVDTIMQVSRFINPEWLIEIEVDAIISDG